jgi:phosphoenolpyruvate synthase/pyruvate phosphate dikinase
MFIKDFKEINKESVSIAGGKGASLGEMTQARIPVPPGFVVLSDAFERFIRETDLNVEIDSILHSVDHKEIHTVEDASEKVKALILAVEMPEDIGDEIQKSFDKLDSKFVAVRSSATAEDSATAAWAGQLETYLNTTEENLLENVKKCWASLFTPRAIFYRFEKGLHGQRISVAVIVQKMIESEVSGIAFSVHPVTQDYNQLIIEASFGLGEAIVSGQITPDSYVVEKEPRRIIDKNVYTQKKALVRGETGGTEWQSIPKEKAEKQVLTDEEILELSELILKIENHYGFPVDIEWAREKSKFYIVQSRPITTLRRGEEKTTELKKLVKTITRDVPLLAIESYYDGIVKQTEDFFGFEFSENVFVFVNGATEIYRENEYFSKQLPAKLSGWVKRHKSRLPETYTGLRDALRLCKVVSAKSYSKAQEITEDLEKLNDAFARGFLGIITTFWFPIWQDTYLKNQNIKPFSDEVIIEVKKVRTETEKFFDGTLEMVYSLLNKLADIENFDIKLLKYLTWQELNDCIKRQSLDLVQIIAQKRRNTKFAYLKGQIIYDQDIDPTLRKFGYLIQQEPITSTNEIKGLVANPGIAKGPVRIIFNREELNKVNQKDILVAPMTTPWYLPAMKKAAAFVTDEGGITSHAAIVAREMNKPCIIGTKIATQVLKDGDKVEVDADEGVVRILSKK